MHITKELSSSSKNSSGMLKHLRTKEQKVFHIKNNNGPRIGVKYFFLSLKKIGRLK